QDLSNTNTAPNSKISNSFESHIIKIVSSNKPLGELPQQINKSNYYLPLEFLNHKIHLQIFFQKYLFPKLLKLS
ncbi:MAG: hypothetical protein AABY27_00310, partial [Pseudomonadota bacterium]